MPAETVFVDTDVVVHAADASDAVQQAVAADELERLWLARTGAVLIDLALAHGLSFRDAMVVTSAARVGASILLSEDLQDGRAFGPVVVRNPFLPRGSEEPDD